MQHLSYFVACSADGFIAHEDGTWQGFLETGAHVDDYITSLNTFGTVIMGRKTYEVGLQAGVTNPYPMLTSYVVSSAMTQSPDAHVKLVNSDPIAFTRDLKQQADGPIYLCGGSTLASQLLQAGLVDKVILKVNPIIFGKGIPVFKDDTLTTSLNLIKTDSYSNGCVWLHYEVAQDAE
ncbi:MAG: dihydrofolate reductase family protein [Deinococcota bacterium]